MEAWRVSRSLLGNENVTPGMGNSVCPVPWPLGTLGVLPHCWSTPRDRGRVEGTWCKKGPT